LNIIIIILEGRIKGKQQIRRPRCKTPDWKMNRDNGYSYQNLKEMARCRRTWKDQYQEPDVGQRT